MERTWYVIDTRTNEIVIAITTSGRMPSLDGFTNPETLRLDAHPPIQMLRRYRYWDERP